MSSTAGEILKTLLNSVSDDYQKTIGFPMYDILAAVSLRLADSARLADDLKTKLDPAALVGDDLDRYIYYRSGLIRNHATFAFGTMHAVGNGTIPAGALVESMGGVKFRADTTTIITGEGDFAVTCMQDGEMGNLPANTITLLPVQIAGIVSVTNLAPTHDGYAEEGDVHYLERYLAYLRTPPTSGNIYHYRQWAMEITGVGSVQVYPEGHGTNTVDVVLVDSNGKPASEALVNEVQAYIDPDSLGKGQGQAPIGARCYVSAADALDLSVGVLVHAAAGYTQEAIQGNIEASINAYLGQIAFKQNYVSFAKIADAVMDADGVLDYENLTVNGGNVNLAVADRAVAVLQEVVMTLA